jgi:hypothetical protein
MSKLQDCAELVTDIMRYSDDKEGVRNETKVTSVLEAMEIFLDADDMVDILKNRVQPKLSKKKRAVWDDYINGMLRHYKYILEDS